MCHLCQSRGLWRNRFKSAKLSDTGTFEPVRHEEGEAVGFGPTYDGASMERCKKVRRMLRAFGEPVLDEIFVPHAARTLGVPEHVIDACLRQIDKENTKIAEPAW